MGFMKVKPKMIWMLLAIVLCFCFFSQFAFAESNATDIVETAEAENAINSVDFVNSDTVMEVSNDNNHEISIDNCEAKLYNSKNTTLFIISDNPGTNILDKASNEIFNGSNIKNVNLVVRSGDQIKAMKEDEVANLLSSCDGFIGEWISGDIDAVLTSVLVKNPSLSNKKIFLI